MLRKAVAAAVAVGVTDVSMAKRKLAVPALALPPSTSTKLTGTWRSVRAKLKQEEAGVMHGKDAPVKHEVKVKQEVKEETGDVAHVPEIAKATRSRGRAKAGPAATLVRVKAEDATPAVVAEDGAATGLTHLAEARPYTGPFPECLRPTAEECWEATAALAKLHGWPRGAANAPRAIPKEPKHNERSGNCGAVPDPLDALFRTILSQNTTGANSTKAYRSLRQQFPAWQTMLHADIKVVADAIRCGGLAETKAKRMQHILQELQRTRGKLSMDYLRELSNDEIKQELSRFPGVGPKTVACVLMFCLLRDEFPVDTHVYRITRALGWVPQTADRNATYEHLNQRVPDHLKYDLHVLLIRHGRSCPHCAANGRPQVRPDGMCPFLDRAVFVKKESKVKKSIAPAQTEKST
eukprot:jgi/Chlat1/4124/Chrsp269S03951